MRCVGRLIGIDQPKQIYYCDFPQCKRMFVRQDLCTRHRERHTNRGSHLQRKDNRERAGLHIKRETDQKNMMGKYSLSPESPTTPIIGNREDHSPSEAHSTGDMIVPQRRDSAPAGANKDGISDNDDRSKYRRIAADSAPEQRRASIAEAQRIFNSAPSDSGGLLTGRNQHSPAQNMNQSNNKLGFNRPILQALTTSTTAIHGIPIQSPFSASPSSTVATTTPFGGNVTGTNIGIVPAPSAPPSSVQQYASHIAFPAYPLPQPAVSNIALATTPTLSYIPTGSTAASGMDTVTVVTTGPMEIDPVSLQPTLPVFGENSYSRSPQWYLSNCSTDFLEYLMMGSDAQGTAQPRQDLNNPFFDNFMGSNGSHSYGVTTSDFQHSFFNPSLNTHPMNINTIAPPSPPQESLLSENKRLQLIDLVELFPEVQTNYPQGIAPSPGCDDDRHPLSLCMMQTFISLYWAHFHPQLPILHRPTFSAEKTQELLLLCIIIIGAACMDFKSDHELAQDVSTRVNTISQSLRWSIFGHEDFRPPAKLWVFQALLLLETFEKMYSHRILHERAHIHHATTLTLMRRGSSLTGRSGAYDSPQSGRDTEGSNMTFNAQQSAGGRTSNDDRWSRWVVQEATKRVAFAAFVIDATHATMFGHSAIMVAHEIKLHLPCDETLWAARSASEVFSIQQSLHQNNIHTPLFLEGLRKILRGQQVATNAFGRTILMAGLLSVAWHLHQKDIQTNELNVPPLSTKEKWRATLTNSFDHWKADFDNSLAKLRSRDFGANYYVTEDVEHENIFESRNVLHHLAHMSMHVDIVDLQIYAGASRLLGRTISRNDRKATIRRMEVWAPTAQARDAAFYAIRFLCQVLLLEERADMQFAEDEPPSPNSRRISMSNTTTGVPVYSARDDHLLNRPWVLYFACLVVWAYGYAIDGPLEQPVRGFTSKQEAYSSMRTFLKSMGNLQAPEDLTSLKKKNDCIGLLLTLRDMFSNCRWELLSEASRLIEGCIKITAGGEIPKVGG
jgi:hypothetical protein